MEHAIDFVDWNELKGKEARGIGGKVDLGEVHGIGRNYVITQKGIANKEKFFIPKYLARGYDGKKLYFDVSEAQKLEFEIARRLMKNIPGTGVTRCQSR
ncbi:MAG: hypothetical protein ABI347_12015 [Nitrososphaera sp.]|jgi:hypothetical protein